MTTTPPPAARLGSGHRALLGGRPPPTMAELGTALRLSQGRTRVALTGGLAKLRTALGGDA